MISFLLFFCLITCNTAEKKIRSDENSDKLIKDLKFLSGRLPGENWQQHLPPKFTAYQSFETKDQLRKCILLLKYQKGDRQKMNLFLANLKINFSATSEISTGILKTEAGQWQTITIRSNKFISRVYALQMADIIIWVQFTAPNANAFAIYIVDAERYIQNFLLGS